MNIQTTDLQRAMAVVQSVDQAFHDGSGLLSEITDLVEYQIPQGVAKLSLEHARFLFYVVSNDHGMKSSRLYAKAKELFKIRPSLFDPSYVLSKFESELDLDLVHETGNFLGTRYPKQTGVTWYLNSKKLVDTYSGDPRRLFGSHKSAQHLMRAICEFRSYGPKTGGLLLRAIVGLGFAMPKDLDSVLLPVDVHDTRIACYTGVLNGEVTGEYHAHVRTVQRVLSDACSSLGIAWEDVDRALWLIGSRGCVNARCAECPLVHLCSRGKELTGLTLLDSVPVGISEKEIH